MAASQQPCEPLEWSTFQDLMSRMSYDVHLSVSLKERLSLARYQLVIALGCYIGLRGSDLLTLKWSDIIGKKSFRFREKKGFKKKVRNTREILLNQELLKIAAASHRTVEPFSNELPIFCNKECNIVSIQELNRVIKVVFKKYGIETVNPSSHTLRKTFGMRVFESQGSTEAALVLLSEIFNHESVEDTRKYIGLTREKIRNAYLKI